MRNALAFAVSFATLVALSPARAQAQSSSPPPAPSIASSATPGESSNAFSVWGMLPWGGYGIGARYMIPFPSIPRLLTHTKFKDYWALEFGADYLHWNYGWGISGDYSWNALLPVASVMWQVWFLPNLGVYPKVELGYEFGWYSGWNDTWGNRPAHGGLFVNGAAGVLYKLDMGLTLRGEVGYAGAKLGVAWMF